MLIYLLVVAIILLFHSLLNTIPQETIRKKREERYLRIVCWILVLLAALRGSSVGTDTIGYVEDYYSIAYMSFAEIQDRFGDYPGYFLLAKTCSLFHFPIQILFGLVEGIYVYAIMKFIDRYSKDKLYSILLFTTIGLYSFSLAGLKQVLSMAFVLLYYISLTEKKYLKTVLFATVAYFCHHVSLVFLFGVVLYYMRNMKAYYTFLTIIVVLLLFASNLVWSNMLALLENDHYSELYTKDEGYSSTTMIFYGVLAFLLFLFSNNYRRNKTEESRVMLGLSILAFALQSLSFVSSAAFRLSFFFVPFMIVGFPNSFNCIGNGNTKRVIKFAVAFIVVFFFFYTARSSVGYVFFWQE